MPSDCIFELNRENGTYFSGETIVGTITLKTSSTKNMRDVCILFLGEGKVKWNETHTKTTSDGRTVTSHNQYRSHETYINDSTCVHGDGVLAIGTHTYNFNIPLPLECPTSCDGKYGYIRYEIALKINRYYRFDNVYKQPVTIIKTVDLNLYPAYKLPIVLETFSSSCCWPCSKGKIFCTLKIPYGAYAPGQIIRYTLQIENQSMDDTEGYFLEFRQKITFTATSPRRKKRHSKCILVSRSFPDKCLRLSNRVLAGEFLIPATPSSTAKTDIIYVEYSLKVTVYLSCCTSNPDLIIPIIIGTIPIRESLAAVQFCEGDQQQQQQRLLPTAPEIEGFGNNLPPNYNDIRPPTFEEAIRSNSPFIDTDIDERNRIVGFRPLYPIYKEPYSGE